METIKQWLINDESLLYLVIVCGIVLTLIGSLALLALRVDETKQQQQQVNITNTK